MSQFSGSINAKTKGDLVKIATALQISDTEGNRQQLIDRIQAKLDKDEVSLKADERFKGLYSGRRRQTASDADEDLPAPKKTPSRPRAKKSLLEVAGIPLPETPIAAKVQEAADSAVAIVEADAKEAHQQLTAVFDNVAKFGQEKKLAVEFKIRDVRNFLSRPAGLIPVALLVEEAFLFTHVASYAKRKFVFPPPAYATGSFDSLLRTLFFWAPRVSWTWCYPKLEAFAPHSALWPAEAWWVIATIVPALLASIFVSFVPQHGVQRGGSVTTRYQAAHPPTPTVDDLTFVFVRLAILLVPLTNAAPQVLVEALEKSGNSQARALGAGLLAALVVAHRFADRA